MREELAFWSSVFAILIYLKPLKSLRRGFFWEHAIGARILGTEACGQGIQCANNYIYWTEMGYVICDM